MSEKTGHSCPKCNCDIYQQVYEGRLRFYCNAGTCRMLVAGTFPGMKEWSKYQGFYLPQLAGPPREIEDAYEDHPIADLFPLMEQEDLAALAKSIKTNGQRVPVILYQGKILDGRNRYRACQIAGVTATTEQYSGDDALAYAISLNLDRRHLTDGQRALLGAKLANLPLGSNQHQSGGSANLPTHVSQDSAANHVKVSPRSIRVAKTILESGNEELIKDVASGQVSLNQAIKIVKLKPAEPAPGKHCGVEETNTLDDMPSDPELGEGLKGHIDSKAREMRQELLEWGLSGGLLAAAKLYAINVFTVALR